MKCLIKLAFLCLLVAPLSCQPDNPEIPHDNNSDTLLGIVEFDFPLPARSVPVAGIHRIDLSIAATTYDLYRGDFLISANVSDRVTTYTFKLLPGDYYFQAGITCSCMGDTCFWDGFPGGRFSTKWAMDKITIIKGEKLNRSIIFPN
jgi:hypothetical protein